jgi:hypothetical protein
MQDEKELARALQASDFETAQRLAVEYGRTIRAQLKAASNLQGRELIFRRAVEYLNDHLYLARVLRAHIAANFTANSAQCLYRRAETDRHCWNLEG